MIDEASNIEYLRARETATEYRKRGYDVALEAPLDFLPGFYADLVVRKDDEVKVIEIKSRSSLAADPRIKELARAVEARPGWSFELLLVPEPEKLMRRKVRARSIVETSWSELQKRRGLLHRGCPKRRSCWPGRLAKLQLGYWSARRRSQTGISVRRATSSIGQFFSGSYPGKSIVIWST